MNAFFCFVLWLGVCKEVARATYIHTGVDKISVVAATPDLITVLEADGEQHFGPLGIRSGHEPKRNTLLEGSRKHHGAAVISPGLPHLLEKW